MLALFRNRRISRMAEEAEAFVSETYTDPEAEIEVLPDVLDEDDVLPDISDEFEEYHTDTEIKQENQNTNNTPAEDAEYSLPKFSLPMRVERKVDESFSRARTTGDYSDLKPVLEKAVSQTFVDKVNEYIQKKDMPAASVYKAAQMDRRLFSKVMSDHEYKPSKDTALAISLALHLSIDEANDLLDRAGYSLSSSSKRDIAIEYFFRQQIYDITDINLVLDKLNMKAIGR